MYVRQNLPGMDLNYDFIFDWIEEKNTKSVWIYL